MKYQIWYKREHSLSMPQSNKAMVIRFAKRLRRAYKDNDGTVIRIRKVAA